MKQSIYILLTILTFFLVPCAGSTQVVPIDMGEILALMNMKHSGPDDDVVSGGGTGGGRIGSGGGASNILIDLRMPSEGKMPKQDALIEWTSEEVNPPFRIEIKDDNDMVIFSSVVNTQQAIIPFSSLAMPITRDYNLRVISAKDNTMISNEIPFRMARMREFEAVENAAKEHPEYADASDVMKIIMKAIAMEKNDYFFEAAKLYRSSTSTDRDFRILSNMRNGFLSRVRF